MADIMNKIVKGTKALFTIFFYFTYVNGVEMKKIIYYALFMITIVVVLPLLIVKGCSAPYEQQKEPPTAEIPKESLKITVYDSTTKKSQTMELEEYIKGVVAAEMPADFELEALKAQAVAARTFTYGRVTGTYASKQGTHDGIDICTDPAHCQAWKSRESAIKQWGILFGNRNWNKIQKAVQETKGVIAVYDGKIANTLFHSNGGGKTEDSEFVWDGVKVPYLRSVESTGDEEAKDFKVSVLIKNSDFIDKFKNEYPDIKLIADKLYNSIKITGYTTGGRVATLDVGSVQLKGTDFRTILGLRSANFKIEKADAKTLKITTVGYGHGVGMSQWGANYLAKRGGTYDEILKYYYTGISIETIDRYKAGM